MNLLRNREQYMFPISIVIYSKYRRFFASTSTLHRCQSWAFSILLLFITKYIRTTCPDRYVLSRLFFHLTSDFISKIFFAFFHTFADFKTNERFDSCAVLFYEVFHFLIRIFNKLLFQQTYFFKEFTEATLDHFFNNMFRLSFI